MATPHTPGKIPGYSYNDAGLKGECNWRKCWALYNSTHTDPFVIQLLDGTLWIVPHEQPEGTWGSLEGPSCPKPNVVIPRPRPNTSTFIGPFASFAEAWATFILMVTE